MLVGSWERDAPRIIRLGDPVDSPCLPHRAYGTVQVAGIKHPHYILLMARAYSVIGILNTTEVAGWDVVDGMVVPFAPDAHIPLALDRTREYMICRDGDQWVLKVRAALAKRRSSGD